MLQVTKKPSWKKARAAAEIMRSLGKKEATAKSVLESEPIVFFDEHHKVLAVVIRGGKKPIIYAPDSKVGDLIKKIDF